MRKVEKKTQFFFCHNNSLTSSVRQAYKSSFFFLGAIKVDIYKDTGYTIVGSHRTVYQKKQKERTRRVWYNFEYNKDMGKFTM